MSNRGNYKGKNYDPNYYTRTRGRQNASNGPSNSDGRAPNPVISNVNQSQPSDSSERKTKPGQTQVKSGASEPSGTNKRKGGRNRRKKSSKNSGNQINKLGNPTKLVLDVKTVDFRRSRTNYFAPPFGPLQEIYHYLKPRLRQYYNDYLRSLQSNQVNYNYEFFYQAFAYRISELYLSKIWLYAAPDRFLSAHYDQIKAILNSTQPVIKEMVQDVSDFVGNFELHDKIWENKFPLLVVSHHWLQAAYGNCSALPWKHLNHRIGLRAIDMSHLPLVITPVGDWWPFGENQVPVDADNLPNYLTWPTDAAAVAASRYIQDWQYGQNPVDLNKITMYMFNGMVDPGDRIFDWIAIPTNRNINAFDYHVGEDNPLEVLPTFHQGRNGNLQRPCLTRFFPWREASRTKSAFIIQFNCEFLKASYNDRYTREGVESISMTLAATLLQLIGSEIDSWMDYWAAEFVLLANPPRIPNDVFFNKKFTLTEPEGWDQDMVNLIIHGDVQVSYISDSGIKVRTELPMRLRYKLPLWWHAYDDFEGLNNMTGFLHPDEGVDEDGDPVDENQYDVESNWWKWVMAGIYPRWQPYRWIMADLESHLSAAASNVQLDFLRTELPISQYKMPDYNGSSVQLSRFYISGQSENISHLTDSPHGEIVNGFVITDRANWVRPTRLGPWNKDFTWLTHFEGLDQVRKIKDLIGTFFPQTAWTISNAKR